MLFTIGPARDCVRREGGRGHAHPQIGRNCPLTNGLGDGSFKLGCREANLFVKREVPDSSLPEIGEQLLSVTILCLSKLIDKTINETRLRLENEHG